jgi:hypothetical protein
MKENSELKRKYHTYAPKKSVCTFTLFQRTRDQLSAISIAEEKSMSSVLDALVAREASRLKITIDGV